MTLPDRRSILRAQLEARIQSAKVDSPLAKRVTLGYALNMHRGRDLLEEGSVVEGLGVVIDREDPQAFRVR